MQRGMDVTVVHVIALADGAPARPVAGGLLRKSLEERGMMFMMGGADAGARSAQDVASPACALPDGERGRRRPGRDGGRHPSEHRTGARRPVCTASAASSSSDTMQTYDARIYAVGECVQHRRQTLRPASLPLFDQAKVCANHLAMKGFATYDGSVVSTKLKVTGHRPVLRRRLRGAARTRKRSSCRTLPAASTSGSSCATRKSSAPCSMAIPSTARGTSSICATAPTFRKCASGWCSAPPISAMAAIAARTRSPA